MTNPKEKPVNKDLFGNVIIEDELLRDKFIEPPFTVPNYETIKIFKWFEAQGHEMIIWSGSGCDWARTWAEKLDLKARIIRKGSEPNIWVVLQPSQSQVICVISAILI